MRSNNAIQTMPMIELRVIGARKMYLAEAAACPAFKAGLAALVSIAMVSENE